MLEADEVRRTQSQRKEELVRDDLNGGPRVSFCDSIKQTQGALR
jgi:hypothetical protein